MDEGVPDFLRIPQDVRDSFWKGRKLTVQGSGFKQQPTKIEEEATRQLRREVEAAEAAKTEARFARLKELRDEKRRSSKSA